MMKSLLHQLYDGEITPQRKECPKSKEYLRQKGECDAHMARFAAGLTAEQGQELEQLLSEWHALFYLESADMFSDAFRLGARMMCEVLAGEE